MKQDHATLLPIVQEVALLLTKKTKSEWILRNDPTEHTYFHITSGNAELILQSAYSDSKRLVVNGSTPRGKDRQYVRAYEDVKTDNGTRWEEVTFSSISVATARGAETIANEIVRRFLPQYLHTVNAVVAKIAADENFETKRRENLQACANTLNATLRSDYRPIAGCDPVYEPVTTFSEYLGRNCSGIRIECKASANDVDLKLDNLTVEQAKQVLALVKNLALPRNLA